MGWCCGPLVAFADLLPTLPTGLRPTCSAAAPCRPSRSNVPAPPATRTTHSTLVTLACRPHLPSLTPSPPRRASMRGARQLCRAAEYVFPDPIPEFAEAEVNKFRGHMMEKLSKKKDMFGTSTEEVVGICTGILSEFLHTEYGGPGTLLVIPFIDMADTINERGLPGGPQAARAAVVWAQKHVDKDWKDWTGGGNSN